MALDGHIATNVLASDYHKRELGVVSKSALDQIARSPAHYKAWADGLEKRETRALAFGRAFHMAVLEPDVFASTYVVVPDFGDCRFKENKTARNEWLAENAGRLAIEAEDMERARGMAASLRAHPAAGAILRDGISEVTLRWADPITGLACKSRADYWVREKKLCADLKTAEDASPEEFAKAVVRRRYDVQDALYRAGFAACGEPIDHFALVACEKEPPYAVGVYLLDTDAVARGYSLARRDIDTLQECLETDCWPSYTSGVSTLSLPAWAYR